MSKSEELGDTIIGESAQGQQERSRAELDVTARTMIGEVSIHESSPEDAATNSSEGEQVSTSAFQSDLPGTPQLGHSSSMAGVRAQSLAPGQLSNQFAGVYELRDQLGAGGMGAVYRAKDKSLHRTVAIKVMHDQIAARQSMVRRFYKEAQITAQLEHPGIVPTYGIELNDQGQPRLAMRLIRGRNLEQVIQEEAALVPAKKEPQLRRWDRLELFLRACEAVDFAHKKGVVHRDLKPENIMVGPHRDAYVMDWGLATVQSQAIDELEAGDLEKELEALEVNVDNDLHATRLGEMMGTVAYMPPEQAKGELDVVGPASDQFAMGMSLQELVTLEAARVAPNLADGVTQAVLGQKVEVPDWVAPQLKAIIQKATAAEVSDRYASMQAFADDIRRFMRDEELSVMPDPFAKKVWRKLSAHQTGFLMGLVAFVILVASFVVKYIAQEADRERAQAAHSQHVAELQGIVNGRAQAINARARGVEIELARLSGIVQQALLRPSEERVKVVTPEEMRTGRGPRDTQKLERYGQLISFERSVFARAPNVDAKAAERDEARLSTLEPNFKHAFDTGGFVRGTRVFENTAPLQWIYAGTPAGVLINYPAGSGLMPDYDPRTRPWYSTSIGTHGPQWGGLYGDASGSGTLLPCNRAVYDNEGELLAVVGIDFRLTDVEAEVPIRELPGYQSAWLLNLKGQIVVHAREEALAGADVQDLGKRELVKFHVPEVLAAVEKQVASGQVVKGKTRYLYASVPAFDWIYVVASDAAL